MVGEGRAQAVVIAYLMNQFGLTYSKASQLTDTRTNSMSSILAAQMMVFEKMGGRMDPTHPEYLKYKGQAPRVTAATRWRAGSRGAADGAKPATPLLRTIRPKHGSDDGSGGAAGDEDPGDQKPATSGKSSPSVARAALSRSGGLLQDKRVDLLARQGADKARENDNEESEESPDIPRGPPGAPLSPRAPGTNRPNEPNGRSGARARPPADRPDLSALTRFEELPAELQRLIASAKISTNTLNAHFQIVLNILYFLKKITLPAIRVPPVTPRRRPAFTPLSEAELMNTTLNPSKVYSFQGLDGEGGYGQVYLAKSAIPPKGKVAIKKVSHVKTKEREHNIAEINCLRFCKHRNIVEFYTSYVVKNSVWLVMEYMEGGTLSEAVKGYNFKEQHIAFVARSLLSALLYLHQNAMAHRDLKSANIMMSIKGQVKLIDFGLCVDMSTGPRKDMVGSPFWMPPEMIQRRPHGLEVDIWSFAISLLELANKVPPHRKNSFKAMFLYATVGVTQPFAEGSSWSEAFRDFLGRALQVDPARRATAAELLAHPFIRKACGDKEMAKILRHIFMTSAMDEAGLF
eukprot:TRINITY_DN9278_c0_g1_i4.p1 TRINITY_DN9278_c0_g1~~TRINITY_DN9278_c0_g1_i4.p1  ORF type:complete len:574 (-),score=59.51 TRINITY_DN9278_c0_g1_i4:62-1783(-)